MPHPRPLWNASKTSNLSIQKGAGVNTESIQNLVCEITPYDFPNPDRFPNRRDIENPSRHHQRRISDWTMQYCRVPAMGPSDPARLQGLFTVYKPSGLKWLHVRQTIELQLLKGLNAQQPSAPEQRVRFLLGPMEGSEEKKLTLTATSVPSLTTHRLVRVPAFRNLKIGVGHRLDVQVSGVLVLAVGHGRSLLTDMYDAHLTKHYMVRGLLGKATDNFCEDGQLIEKTREWLDQILAIIQGSHQKALVMSSNLDLKSQDAYKRAVQGVILPMNESPMLIAGICCLHYAPPEFLLRVQCMHEREQQLRRLVHDIGLELKTTPVRRTRDGFFRLDNALLGTQWDLHSI